jgi:FG-GAP repeat/FG-GAP-like repeat
MGVGGDLDGDGVAELLLSATGDSEPALAAVRGPISGEANASAAWSTWTGQAGSSWSSTTAVLDLDGDGDNELAAVLIGDDWQGPCTLRLYAPSATGGAVAAEDAAARLSYSPQGDESCHPVQLVDAGDLDGDGLVDLAVGMPFATGQAGLAGQVWLVQASSLALTALDDVATSWLGQEREEEAGSALAAGDFDGDGARDLAVGTSGKPAGERRGGFAVDLGPIAAGRWTTGALELSWTGENRLNGYSYHPMVSGDFDGDGVDDLALGSSAWPSLDNIGAVYVFGAGLFER